MGQDGHGGFYVSLVCMECGGGASLFFLACCFVCFEVWGEAAMYLHIGISG